VSDDGKTEVNPGGIAGAEGRLDDGCILVVQGNLETPLNSVQPDVIFQSLLPRVSLPTKESLRSENINKGTNAYEHAEL
jgi:hypothetical protein